jgi:hypothetical protein
VGANNSGKTSATQAVYTFVKGAKDRLSLFDFSSHAWKLFDEIGDKIQAPELLPRISLDLWFSVAETDLHLVLPLLPSMTWQGTQVGLRIEFASKNPAELLKKFHEARDDAIARAAALDGGPGDYKPWPKSLSDYLFREMPREFEFVYYVLDQAQFDEDYAELNKNYQPALMTIEPGGAAIVRSLVRVDNLNAQRHLADPNPGNASGAGRWEDLSKRLSRFYQRNLDQKQEDHSALRALFNSEAELNKHLEKVFEPTLKKLGKLGYPGLNNPQLKIRSALNPASVMSQDARVHYALDGDATMVLPDTYNGLGFKNLIYMVVEILDLQAQWISDEQGRPPLHIIFIEEPEAHLHAQLQQVFIRNVLDLLRIEGEGEAAFHSQVVLTTHSPHILYERGFKPIGYFRRRHEGGQQTTAVLNLSAFYSSSGPKDRDFLERYLKLTHCDLFFADAAILVEGNVERLLLPVMIEKEAISLRSTSVCILEVGGAFGHRFKSLIEYLGLVALVITDLDSVTLIADASQADDDRDTHFEVLDEKGARHTKVGKACLPDVEGAITSNQTLIQWLPKKQTVKELFAATSEHKCEILADDGAKVRITYQTPSQLAWKKNAPVEVCGRTLEEAFGLENAAWCQDGDRRHVGLRLRKSPDSVNELAVGLSTRVNGSSFNKTNFALAVLTEPIESWVVPQYIKDGLQWLVATLEPERKIEEELGTGAAQ